MSRLGATGSATSLASADNPTYQLIQLDRTGDPLRAAPVERDPMSGLYSYPVTEGPFACPGETFWAKLARINATSQLVSAAPAYTDACFRRSRINAQATRALLLCEEGHRCEIDNEIPGIAEACSDIIKVRAPVETETQHWVVPSLSTLERQSDAVRPGYAEFTIESEPLPGLADATELSFAVRSNGVPIYMDGLAHHLDRVPFNGKGGVHLTFALENLGFTGGTDGYEQIEVELRYYAGKAVIKTALLKARLRLLPPYPLAVRHGCQLGRELSVAGALSAGEGSSQLRGGGGAWQVRFDQRAPSVVQRGRKNLQGAACRRRHSSPAQRQPDRWVYRRIEAADRADQIALFQERSRRNLSVGDERRRSR